MSGVHSKDTLPHKGGPHNSTGKTQALPSIDTATSPISTDQEIYREVVQGVLDDPRIPRSLVAAAWERARNHFSPKIDNLQSGHQRSQPTSNHSYSIHLGAAKSTNSFYSYHKGTASDSNQNSNP